MIQRWTYFDEPYESCLISGDMVTRAPAGEYVSATDHLAALRRVRTVIAKYKKEQHDLSCDNKDDEERIFETISSIIDDEIKEAGA
jgi:hypothetical protein